MDERMTYVTVIKRILDADYGKERVFYQDGEWYDRDTSSFRSVDEIASELYKVAAITEEQNEYMRQVVEKLYSVMEEGDAEAFFSRLENRRIDKRKLFELALRNHLHRLSDETVMKLWESVEDEVDKSIDKEQLLD